MISLYSQTSGPRADAIDFGEAANGRGFRLESAVILPHPRECVFAFFADAMQLETLTPTWLQFEVVTPGPICLQEGAIIDYRLKLHGFPIRWRSRISVWEPPFRFVDEQIRGPYRRWEHEHLFEEVDGGTKVTQHAVFQSVADRDGMKESGMEQHAPVAMAQLQDVAQRL